MPEIPKPLPIASDIEYAKQAARTAKRLSAAAKLRLSGRMDQPDLGHHEALDLANAAKDAAYHLTWLLKAYEESGRASARP